MICRCSRFKCRGARAWSGWARRGDRAYGTITDITIPHCKYFLSSSSCLVYTKMLAFAKTAFITLLISPDSRNFRGLYFCFSVLCFIESTSLHNPVFHIRSNINFDVLNVTYFQNPNHATLVIIIKLMASLFIKTRAYLHHHTYSCSCVC